MDTIRIVVFFISVFSSISAHSPIPSILVQEGQSAEISCLAKGSHEAYFWWKGEYLHNSTEIASFVGGIPSSPSGPYKATENGTLIIKKVSLDDEGKYICRVSSALSDCNGVVMVYVQASIPGFALGIDLCDGDASCVIHIPPSKSTKLTCQATDASPSMELKWFNGSTEITKGIESEDPVMKGTSRVISATVNVAPEFTRLLICQAVDPKTKDVGGRFAHVQLELPGSAITEASTGWMVTAIIFLVTCIILIAAFAFIIVKSRETKGEENNKQEEEEQLMTKINDKDSKLKAELENVKELTTKINDKDNKLKAEQEKVKELTTKFNDKDNKLKAEQEKVKELTTNFNDKDNNLKAEQEKVKELATKISEKDSEIKSRDEHIMELTKKVYDATSDIKVKDVSAKAQTQIKDNELQVKVRELTKLQEEVDKKDNEMKSTVVEITQLKEIIQSQGNAIKQKDEDLSRLKALESKFKDISSKHEAAVKREKESLDKLKTLKSEEENIKKDITNLENSERSFRAKKMDDLGNNYVTVIPKEGSLVGIKNDGKGFTLKHSSTMYKFPHIFSIGAAASEIYEKVNCYVENAVDGGDSLVIAFGTSKSNPQFTTMYGDTEWKSAILPLTYKRIFERADQLKTRKYAITIRSRFVRVLEDEHHKETFIVPESTFADICQDPMTIPSTLSKDENSIERLFIEHRESITKKRSKHNCFVQFLINTEVDNTKTTGTITLTTLLDATVAKSIFEKKDPKSPLGQFLADIAYKANSRCLLLVHLSEDKEDMKEVLKVAKTIAEGKMK